MERPIVLLCTIVRFSSRYKQCGSGEASPFKNVLRPLGGRSRQQRSFCRRANDSLCGTAAELLGGSVSTASSSPIR
jgi:hypothetical protein